MRDEPVDDELDRAVEALRAGGLVAFPTETVYGLGADAANDNAVTRLFAVKRRPPDHPVIVHLASSAQLTTVAADVPDAAARLAAAFWPGPLTLVVGRRAAAVSDRVTGGRDTVAVRVPAHPLALALLERFGSGVAAPSANRFGRVSPTTAAHVRGDLGSDVEMVLDGGPSTIGVESTIVDVSERRPRVLRLGGITAEQLATVLGEPVPLATGGEVAAPGTLAQHYAPRARVELVEECDVERRVHAARAIGAVGLLALAGVAPDVTGVTVLDAPRDVDEYARVLYRRLREADAAAIDVLLVVPPPDTGIGAAVRDRLERAANR